MITKINLAWLAALVDGEGTLAITRHKHGPKRVQKQPSLANIKSYTPVLSVYNTDPRLMTALVERTGIDKVYQWKTNKKYKTKRTNYKWKIGPTEMRWLLPLLRPFLVLKGEQADLTIRFLELADLRKPRKGQLPYTHPTLVAARVEMEQICVEVSSLNGRVDGKRNDTQREMGGSNGWRDRTTHQ